MAVQVSVNSAYIPYLEQCALFKGLDRGGLEIVAQAARLLHVKKGAFFFYQDQPATTLYVLIEGRVKFTQVTPDGQQLLLRVIGPGEMFGTVAALGDAFHPASGQASSDCMALGWKSDDISALIERFPRIAANAIRFLAGRLSEFQDRYRELATERVERRVARTLLRLSGQIGKREGNGVLIDLPLTRQEIAEMSGTTLFTASRILSGWQQQGLIRGGRERVLILNAARLKEIAETAP